MYRPRGRARAPHVWLADGRSTLDLFGRGFVLLCLGGDSAGTAALEAAARTVGMPLETIHLDDDAVAAAYERKLVLVRPDGHVAWRSDRPPADAAEIIDRIRGAT